jgi:predicted RNase H-like HicB family nuclease
MAEGGKPMKYAVIIESGPRNYSAYVPDLPGCVATGHTIEEVRENIRGAIAFHLRGMAEDGDPIPEPTCIGDNVEVPYPVLVANHA